MNKLNPSLKQHLSIGVFIAIWGFSFTFLIRPFDDGTLSFNEWLSISIGFNVISFLAYILLSIIQKIIYQKIVKWNLSLEIASLLFYQTLFTIGVFFYYKSPVFLSGSGGYTFWEFCTKIIFKSALILIPIIIMARRYSVKLIPLKEDVLIIKGDYKLDVLKIKKSDLVGISNAQNYVEIFFINNNELKSKLIRSSLKKILDDLDFLIQIHRSHLINPAHFKSWKNQNTVSLTFMEFPVSKNYKENILSL